MDGAAAGASRRCNRYCDGRVGRWDDDGGNGGERRQRGPASCGTQGAHSMARPTNLRWLDTLRRVM